ncbi:MAG: hypothetical protein GY869_23460 [Planctomycetes bacterium]|nr:hypothetical protein [Planctomycetota bacterium]
MKNKHWLMTIAILLILSSLLWAQTASLYVEGVLRDSDGTVVADGDYAMTFIIYDSDNNVKHTQNATITITDGIYKVVLSGFSPSMGFDEDYFLGVTVDGEEFSNKIQLSTAPYALSLIGIENALPSSGSVAIGKNSATSGEALEVEGNVVLRDPSNNPSLVISPSNAGYGVDPELVVQSIETNDDDDAPFQIARNAMFDGADHNRIETGGQATRILLDNDGDIVFSYSAPGDDPITWQDNVRLTADGDLYVYNGVIRYSTSSSGKGWRLIHRDDFESSVDDWNAYSSRAASSPNNSYNRYDLNGADLEGLSYILIPSNDNDDILKKGFSIPSGTTSIQIKLTYHFLDTWDNNHNDSGWIGVSTTTGNDTPTIVWSHKYDYLGNFDASYYDGNNNTYSDTSRMTKTVVSGSDFAGGTLCVFVGAKLNENMNNEHFGIDNVEIWVR